MCLISNAIHHPYSTYYCYQSTSSSRYYCCRYERPGQIRSNIVPRRQRGREETNGYIYWIHWLHKAGSALTHLRTRNNAGWPRQICQNANLTVFLKTQLELWTNKQCRKFWSPPSLGLEWLLHRWPRALKRNGTLSEVQVQYIIPRIWLCPPMLEWRKKLAYVCSVPSPSFSLPASSFSKLPACIVHSRNIGACQSMQKRTTFTGNM